MPKPKFASLAIGVSDYQDAKITKLDFAHKDAEDLAQALRDHSHHLFSKIETKVLSNKEATRREILRGLVWLRLNMTARDFGIVFFAGHAHETSEDVSIS